MSRVGVDQRVRRSALFQEDGPNFPNRLLIATKSESLCVQDGQFDKHEVYNKTLPWHTEATRR
jgi:hypothetical protein